MDLIKEIIKAFKEARYEYSLHAVDQSVERHITRDDVHQIVEAGEIIEDYPEDKYGPSCLIAGQTKTGKWIHVQCSYPSRYKAKIITLYEPDPDEWIDFKIRRKT
jgi:hypothetical protein